MPSAYGMGTAVLAVKEEKLGVIASEAKQSQNLWRRSACDEWPRLLHFARNDTVRNPR